MAETIAASVEEQPPHPEVVDRAPPLPTTPRSKGRARPPFRRIASTVGDAASASSSAALHGQDQRRQASSQTRRRHRFSITSWHDWDDDLAHVFDKMYQYDQSAHKLITKVIDWTHTNFQGLPDFLQDNEYLHKFHRPQLGSFYLCCKSVFQIHTETGNIWTHLIGCLMFIGILSYYVVLPSEYLFDTIKGANIALSEKLAFIVFCLSAVACMAFSTGFHTFGCHSVAWARVWCKLDYVGIACMIAGSFVPWIHYGFYCQFFTKVTYMVIVSVLSAATIAVCMLDKFSQPQYRAVRALVFSALGLFGVVPFVHLIWTDVFVAFLDSGVVYLIIMAVLYITGAALYACRIPERFWPGRFDLLFQSHQLFHCCVVIAALVQLRGIRQLALWRLASAGTSCALLQEAMQSAVNAHDEI